MPFRFLLVALALITGHSAFAEDEVKVEIGRKAPDFAATGIDDKSFKLSDRTGKDKNIILMFSRANW